MGAGARYDSGMDQTDDETIQQYGIQSVGLFGRHYKAERFEVLSDPDRCELHDDQQRLMLVHKFSLGPEDRFPWTNKTDGPMTAAWTVDEKVQWYGDTHQERPIYRFEDIDAYKLFQNKVRKQDFVEQFEMASITPRPSAHQRSEDSYIKIWQSRTETRGRTITVPIRAGDEMDHRELRCIWLSYKRKDSKDSNSPELQLSFKSGKEKRNSLSAISRAPTCTISESLFPCDKS